MCYVGQAGSLRRVGNPPSDARTVAVDGRRYPGASRTLAPWRIVYTNCYDKTVVVSGFEWDDDNALHIERHGSTPEEVEEVFASDHKIRRTRQRRYIALGETWTAAWPSSCSGACPEVWCE